MKVTAPGHRRVEHHFGAGPFFVFPADSRAEQSTLRAASLNFIRISHSDCLSFDLTFRLESSNYTMNGGNNIIQNATENVIGGGRGEHKRETI